MDIHLRTIYPALIVIENERIVDIQQIDYADECFILPAFVDSHIHIESSLLTPSSFAALALRHGTVATVSDPHEIANVVGVEGVKFMIEDGKRTKLKFNWTAPSCVPATSFETAGAILDSVEVRELLQLQEVVALGEMMNYPGVIQQDKEVLLKCLASIEANKVIDGHAPGLHGNDLKKYIEAGITTDHECVTMDEAIEKVNLGMKILIREGSSAKNYEALRECITSFPDKVMFCSDDLHSEDLIRGHMNRMVKRALGDGYDLFDVLRIVSLNPVEHYRLPVGLLRVGDFADFVVVDRLDSLNIKQTWVNGVNVFDDNLIEITERVSKRINNFSTSFVTPEQIIVQPTGKMVSVIEVEEGSIVSKRRIYSLGSSLDTFMKENKVHKLMVKCRYNDTAPAVALVKGFGNLRGALATSIAHDSHNIVAVGSNDKDLLACVNAIISHRGGIAVSLNGKTDLLELPVAGLMSDLSAKLVSERFGCLLAIASDNGCSLASPFMTLSFLALLVIPELKLSDRGLFDVNSFAFTSLFSDK